MVHLTPWWRGYSALVRPPVTPNPTRTPNRCLTVLQPTLTHFLPHKNNFLSTKHSTGNTLSLEQCGETRSRVTGRRGSEGWGRERDGERAEEGLSFVLGFFDPEWEMTVWEIGSGDRDEHAAVRWASESFRIQHEKADDNESTRARLIVLGKGFSFESFSLNSARFDEKKKKKKKALSFPTHTSTQYVKGVRVLFLALFA